MRQILDVCFDGRPRIDCLMFRKINEEVSSDTVLAVLGLFRERLPCSENFWRYKRNYDLHVRSQERPNSLGAREDTSMTGDSLLSKSVTKRIASPKMRHVRALSPYSKANIGL